MDYDVLLNLASDLGYGLMASGAEIYRVEESIQRLLIAYGMEKADPFVIPNCIIVSFLAPGGKTLTQVRRIPSHGTDVDLIERYNDLCRTLCRETPSLEEARRRLLQIGQTLMALVPGLSFTNAIRDVMAGDMVAGVTKIADALLTGVSIALGTGFALALTRLLWGV